MSILNILKRKNKRTRNKPIRDHLAEEYEATKPRGKPTQFQWDKTKPTHSAKRQAVGLPNDNAENTTLVLAQSLKQNRYSVKEIDAAGETLMSTPYKFKTKEAAIKHIDRLAKIKRNRKCGY